MKKLKEVLGNKKGSSYIPVCIFTLIVVMVIGILLQYAFVYNVIRKQRVNIQLTLDSFITKEAIEYYDALKQGEPYRKYIDESELVRGAYSSIGFSQAGISEYTASDNSFTMHRPTITALAGDSVGVSAVYTLSVPFELWGRKVADINIPVEIISKLTER